MSIIPAVSGNSNASPPVSDLIAIQMTSAIFQIDNTYLYVSVVTFSINGNLKSLENVKQGFERTVSWNNYTSKIITQTKNNNLDYLIDSALGNINGLFVPLFKNGNKDPTRDSFDKY